MNTNIVMILVRRMLRSGTSSALQTGVVGSIIGLSLQVLLLELLVGTAVIFLLDSLQNSIIGRRNVRKNGRSKI